MSGKVRAGFWGIAAVTLFAAHRLADGGVLSGTSVLAAEAVRGILAGGLLAVIFRHEIKSQLNGKVFVTVGVCAFLGYFLNQGLNLVAFDKGSGEGAGLFVLLSPLVILGCSLALRQERPVPLGLAALAIGLGSTLAFYFLAGRGGLPEPGAGVIFLAATVSYGAGIVLAKKFLPGAGLGTFASLYLILGGLMAGALSFGELPRLFDAPTSGTDLLFLVFDVLVSTALGTWLFFKALEELKPSTLGTLLYMAVPATVLLQLIQGQGLPPHPVLGVAAAAVVAAIVALFADES